MSLLLLFVLFSCISSIDHISTVTSLPMYFIHNSFKLFCDIPNFDLIFKNIPGLMWKIKKVMK